MANSQIKKILLSIGLLVICLIAIPVFMISSALITNTQNKEIQTKLSICDILTISVPKNWGVTQDCTTNPKKWSITDPVNTIVLSVELYSKEYSPILYNKNSVAYTVLTNSLLLPTTLIIPSKDTNNSNFVTDFATKQNAQAYVFQDTPNDQLSNIFILNNKQPVSIIIQSNSLLGEFAYAIYKNTIEGALKTLTAL
jgi:hypothetical protein